MMHIHMKSVSPSMSMTTNRKNTEDYNVLLENTAILTLVYWDTPQNPQCHQTIVNNSIYNFHSVVRCCILQWHNTHAHCFGWGWETKEKLIEKTDHAWWWRQDQLEVSVIILSWASLASSSTELQSGELKESCCKEPFDFKWRMNIINEKITRISLPCQRPLPAT